MAAEPQFADLVFEGGGVKGIGLAGAYAALEQRGYRPKTLGVGTTEFDIPRSGATRSTRQGAPRRRSSSTRGTSMPT